MVVRASSFVSIVNTRSRGSEESTGIGIPQGNSHVSRREPCLLSLGALNSEGEELASGLPAQSSQTPTLLGTRGKSTRQGQTPSVFPFSCLPQLLGALGGCPASVRRKIRSVL